VSARWSPFSGAVAGFYCLPALVLIREGFSSDWGLAHFAHYILIVLFAGMLGATMGWMICVLRNNSMARR
jgi:hypothetical protein